VSMSQFTIGSRVFGNLDSIPSLYTCEGSDISPPLEWTNAPPETKCFALVVQDPDAPDPMHPQRVWTHWILYNIPATTNYLAEGLTKLPSGTRNGLNDWGHLSWNGPCPPVGQHRYFFKLYALDTLLEFHSPPNRFELEKAMNTHIIAHAELIGVFKKQKQRLGIGA
jgi:Raf kinase inhibitor-like YbhB/YbcL family protein